MAVSSPFRVGFGYDVHRLVGGRRFLLCGVEVTSDFGPLAHSDGDVCLHALCDALLGAAALGDIGHHFPDTSPEFAGIASSNLTHRTLAMVQKAGWAVVNVDMTLLLERPKVAPYVPAMRAQVAELLSVPQEAVSLKATTSEGMGFVGSGDGVACYVVVLLQRN